MYRSAGKGAALRAGILVLLISAGCAANRAPVLNVQNAPVVTSVPANGSLVRDAIIRALASRNWRLLQEAPGTITASVENGGHAATVSIQYDERQFSITHVDSSPGMQFDGATIHRRYNHWVDRLRASIKQELMRTGYMAPLPPPGYAVPPVAAPPG